MNEKALEIAIKTAIKKYNEVDAGSPEIPEAPDLHICDLMPIGDYFCGLEVTEHNRENIFSALRVDSANDFDWLGAEIAQSIYDAEMELRELRRSEARHA